MRSLLHDVVRTGLVAGVASTAAALLLSRVQSGRAAPAMNAVSHMADGGPPPADSGPRGRNFLLGSALHLGASLFWAAWFEPLAGQAARRRGSNAWAGAAATALFVQSETGVRPHRRRLEVHRHLQVGRMRLATTRGGLERPAAHAGLRCLVQRGHAAAAVHLHVARLAVHADHHRQHDLATDVVAGQFLGVAGGRGVHGQQFGGRDGWRGRRRRRVAGAERYQKRQAQQTPVTDVLAHAATLAAMGVIRTPGIRPWRRR